MVRSGYEKRTDPPVLVLKAEASFLNTDRDWFRVHKNTGKTITKENKKKKKAVLISLHCRLFPPSNTPFVIPVARQENCAKLSEYIENNGIQLTIYWILAPFRTIVNESTVFDMWLFYEFPVNQNPNHCFECEASLVLKPRASCCLSCKTVGNSENPSKKALLLRTLHHRAADRKGRAFIIRVCGHTHAQCV